MAGVTVTKIEYSDNQPIPGYFSYYYSDLEGLYFYGDIFESYDTPDLLCKTPCVVGDTWYRSGVIWEVIATSESVTVPDGTYDCIHMRETIDDGGATTNDLWYKIAVGEIKSISNGQTKSLVDKNIN